MFAEFSVQDGERCSVFGGSMEESAKTYLDVADLHVYQKLCELHIEICDLSHAWPAEERYELGAQIRRSSNSSPAQLAEKNDDRHVRNKVEGVNRSRGEAAETLHHLFMAKLKGYIQDDVFMKYRERYKQCIRMLNGIEKSLERYLPEQERRWVVAEAASEYEPTQELLHPGWPSSLNTEPRTLNPDPEHRTPNTKSRTPNTEHRTLNPDPEHRTPNPEHRTPDPRPPTPEHRTPNTEP